MSLISKAKFMSTWCTNHLTVAGDSNSIKKFKNKVKTKGRVLSLNEIFPVPKKLENTYGIDKKDDKLEKLCGASSEDQWCLKNWGTRGDTIDPKILKNCKGKIVYDFSTLGIPPVDWLAVASEKFPKLKFDLEYFVYNTGLIGTVTAENGKCMHDFDEIYADMKSFEVIQVNLDEPLEVKFIDRGMSLSLSRKDEDSNSGFSGMFYKVEHNGKIKMLELDSGLVQALELMRVKGRKFTLLRKMIGDQECVGMHEITELVTVENFKKVYRFNYCSVKKPQKKGFIIGKFFN